MMRRKAFRWMAVGAGFLFVVHPTGVFATQGAPAQPPSSVQEPAAPHEIPARLRYLEGTVTVQRAAAGKTEAADINLPLGTGDRVWSSDDGRVELMFEDGTSIWMDADTTLDLVSLRPRNGREGLILRLWTGSVFVHRPVPITGALQPLRFDAPSGAVRFDEPGLFRVDLDRDQSLWLSVYDGSAVLEAGGLRELVTAGQRTLAQLDSAPARAVAFNTAEADAFSSWRDGRMLLYASSYRYVRERDYVPETIVRYAADLEPYGSWSYHSTYGSWYWKPYAAVSWSPYRDGRWVYTYGGWSWVPAAPWGYVTTHYGRWHHSAYSGWMWFPGRVWTPASVHWYIGPSHVGWVPLNYYGRPAVSFGVHFGGGSFGVSVGYGGYGGYDPYYRYYGNRGSYGYGGYHGFGGHYGFAGHYGYGGHHGYGGRYGSGYNQISYSGGRGGNGVRVGPIGSASRTGRVVNNAGYASGLGAAWTVVPSEDFGDRNVGRAAVARSALPRGLDQASKALVSGPLRARRPATLIPRQASRATTPTALSARRAVPSGGALGIAPSTSRNAVDTLTPVPQRRSATPRLDSATLGTNGVSTAGSTVAPRRAVPTRSQAQGNGVSGVARAPTSGRSRGANVATRATRDSSSSATRRATPRRATVAPASTSQAVSGAVRRALTPSATRSRTPAAATKRYPTVRSNADTTGGASRYPTARRATPSAGATRYPTARRAVPSRPATAGARTPSRPASRPSAVRSPTRSSGASSPSVRSATPSRSAPTVRSAPRAQPAGGRSGASVRPAAPAGSSGGSKRTAVRRTRGRGGAPKPDGGMP